MADKKSCVEQWTTLECMRCGHREIFSEHQFKITDGLSCEVCKGPTIPSKTKPDEPVRNRRMKKYGVDIATEKDMTAIGVQAKKAGNGIGSTLIKIDMDVSDTLKGLKAVQREAKKAAQAMKEVEGYCNLENLSDDDILAELGKRDWDIEEIVLKNDIGIPVMTSVNMNKNYKE